MTSYVPLPLRWRPLQDEVARGRIERILCDWEGTPYARGQRVKQVGVFCTAFVCAVLDELYGREPVDLPEIPDDASMHDPARARAGLRWFLRQYPCDVVEDGFVEPGDVLITGPIAGGPGHAIFVGPQPGTLWQASGPAVHFTGMSIPGEYSLHAVYRLRERQKWSSK